MMQNIINHAGTSFCRIYAAVGIKRIDTPSVIQADTLFTFMTELRYLLSILENRMISPRYNDETINYLRIPKIKKIAFPMKCFCDIPLSKIFA